MNGETQMNEEMAEKLVEATSAADVQAIANSYGKELTMDKAQEMYDWIQTHRPAEGELSEEQLAEVSGGDFWDWTGLRQFGHQCEEFFGGFF